MLFGVRVKVDPMRKSASMNNLSDYEPVINSNHPNNNNNNEAAKVEADDGVAAGYASADDAVPQASNGSRERKRGQISDHLFCLYAFRLLPFLVDSDH